MPRTDYRVTLLITHADSEEEIRTVHQEAWTANEAIELAKQRVWDEEPEVEDVESQGVV